MTRRRWAPHAGQAALEVVASVPVLIAAGLLAWQVVAVLWTGIRAEEAARRAALSAHGTGLVTVERAMAVPGPLADGLTFTVRARVIAP